MFETRENDRYPISTQSAGDFRQEKLCFLERQCFVNGMSYELTGTVKEIFEEQTFDSGFNKRAFVVTSEADKYPQDIQFECLKDRVEMVGKLTKGDKVTVSFDINGRKWNGKYFVNLVAWKIESGSSRTTADGDEPPLPDPDEDFDQEPPF